MNYNLAAFQTISLSYGSHPQREEGMCAMEAAAFIAGEPHSDRPLCVDEAITVLMIRFNDKLKTDEERNHWIKPLIPRVLGTRTTDRKVFLKRTYACANFVIHRTAPLRLRSLGREELAVLMEAIPEIVDHETAFAARDLTRIDPCFFASQSIDHAAVAAEDVGYAYAAYRAVQGAGDTDAAYGMLMTELIESLIAAGGAS